MRSSIGEIFDLVFKPVLDIQDQARLTAAKKKMEEEKKKTEGEKNKNPAASSSVTDEKKYNACMEKHQWRKYGYDDYHELEDKCMKKAVG